MAYEGTVRAEHLSVGEVAGRSGVPVSTIRFYEAQGLIEGWRNAGNQRRYGRDVLRRVAFVRLAQQVGIPLREIGQALASLPGSRTPTADDWLRLSAEWKGRLELRIARLTQLRDNLGHCIGCGCLSLSSCPLYTPDDRLGADGAGARLLRIEEEDTRVESDAG